MSTVSLESDRLRREFRDVIRVSRLAAFWPIASLVIVLFYLVYAWFAFDIPGLIERSRLDRGVILAVDSFAHKYHVTRTDRDGRIFVDVEGQRGTELETPPDWVSISNGRADIDLDDGYRVVLQEGLVEYTVPDGRIYRIEIRDKEVILDGYRSFLDDDTYRYIPPGASRQTGTIGLAQMRDRGILPPGASFTSKKFEVRPVTFKRLQVTRGRIQVHRYFFGWEYFWFAPRSPLSGKSAGEIWDLVVSGDRVDPARSNATFVFLEFWRNSDWQHGEVFVALLETIIMALLGTAIAAGVGLPLAFAAAANFNPVFITRMAVRRLFDFLRGIDQLIWSLIFIRAFGLGPMTGMLAIGFTDTGTLGKLFSEAIENIENKQVEGVRSTGAGAIQRYRFGVIPQILPVFVSQTLYYLESNTRSATVIGALGAGGIGLKLVETLRTGKDWENTFYIIILTLMVVIAMDISSGWLRRKLIGENEQG